MSVGRTKEYKAEYRRRNAERLNALARARYAKDPSGPLSATRRYRDKLRAEVFAAYGGRCACCAEARQEFLAVDHIHGGGRQHRKQVVPGGFYAWLRRAGYPTDAYRLLCHNCNFALGIHGYCPHAREREAMCG